jgi:murein DD-endopeptidase MepM/ murein hydrolase activator NlpD
MAKDLRFLFRPVTPWKINQNFGENLACIDIKTGTKTIACDGLNPPQGYRSIYSQMSGHSGVDLFALNNQPIYASQDGIVAELVDEKVRGLGLGIITTNKFYCKETKKNEHFKVRYWHNARHNVRLGSKVFIGDLIAWADNTGYSAGDHLHWELKPVEVKWNKDGSIKSYKNILQTNGFFGACDPLPYTREENAVKFQGIKSLVERLAWMIT